MSTNPDGIYVVRAFAAIDRIHQDKNADVAVRQYLSVACAECGDRATDNINYDFDEFHVVHRGWVVVGCEGFQQINPNVLGIETPNWSDWTDVHNVPAVPKTKQQAIDFIWWTERSIGGGFHPDTPASDYRIYENGEEKGKLFNQTEERLFEACREAAFELLDDAEYDLYGVSVDAVQFLHPEGWDLDEYTADALAYRAQEAQISSVVLA